MHLTLCDTFRELAQWTWYMLAKARFADSQIGEETLTDLNILELKLRHVCEVYTRTFNKRQEGKNGADWEWWFTGSSGKWIGFRVQAKVIDIRTDSFEHLHYKKDKDSKFQCDILIETALKKRRPHRPLIPLYCLYSNWNSLSQTPDWRCQTYFPLEQSYGCSILSAFEVYYLRTGYKIKKKSLKDLLNYMKPWHCLVCCRQGIGRQGIGDLPHRVFRYWRDFIVGNEERIFDELSVSASESLNDDQDNYRRIENYRRICNEIELLDDAPDYVQFLLNNDLQEQPDPNLRTITIFKERDEPI